MEEIFSCSKCVRDSEDIENDVDDVGGIIYLSSRRRVPGKGVVKSRPHWRQNVAGREIVAAGDDKLSPVWTSHYSEDRFDV